LVLFFKKELLPCFLSCRSINTPVGMKPFMLVLAVCAVAFVTSRGRLHAFLALLLAACVFAFGAGTSVSQAGKSFGLGFGQAANVLGLAVLAAALVGAMAAPLAVRWPGWARASVLAVVGVLAGTGAVPGASFAVLAPLRAAIGGGRARGALTLGLAVSAGQAFLLPSPVLIAATAILAAPWMRVLAYGVPLAVAAGAGGAVFAAWATREDFAPVAPGPGVAKGPWPAIVASCGVMALLLCVASLGDIPSEPLGGGSSRELILGLGRPMIVLLAGVGVMALVTGAWRRGGLSDDGWTSEAIRRAAPLILLVAAAGGLQALTQTAHMAELVAELLLPLGLGIALPFLLAAAMKLLQGSSLVAAITAAGMMQDALAGAGLDNAAGRTLAVLAVGAGAMCGSHINDGFFWLVADAARLRPARALVLVTGGTVLQGAGALAVLAAIRAMI
jgi:GntP family gluconate:H+ symporter